MSIDRRRHAGGYVPLRDAIDQLFAGSVITPQFLGSQGSFPPVDVYVTENDVVLEMSIPGVRPDDINISVTGDTVTVSGEVRGPEQAQRGQAYLDEIWRGRFQRSFSLPIQVDADKAEATFENGLLELRLPKSEATRPRRIQVGTRGGGQGQGTENVPITGGSST